MVHRPLQKLGGVDIIFCPPLICVSNAEKPKNIIFSPWGHKNIYNGMVQLVWTP